MKQPILKVRDLKVHYPVRGGWFAEKKTLKAVDGVSFDVMPGEIMGLVGESGCGKSSLGRAIMRLNKCHGGSVEIDGVDFLALKGNDLRRARPNLQMIFQDPYASLDPRMPVFDIVAEPLRAHRNLSRAELNAKIKSSLDLVGLSMKAVKKYPHEFSGGQRQRIAIARALILDPKIVIADEPVSSLDVSVQAQILNLLKEIQARLGLSMIFISHNLAVVKYISDRIAVMYLGRIVEMGRSEAVYRSPQHPYTQALISAVPIPDPRLERERKRVILTGDLPSPVNPPSGCTFHTRCPWVTDRCRQEAPTLAGTSESNYHVSCFEAERMASQTKAH